MNVCHTPTIRNQASIFNLPLIPCSHISSVFLVLLPLIPYSHISSVFLGTSWSWSYGSWIYNYLCNQWLAPLMLWVRISIRARCTTLCDKKKCQWFATGQWFSPSSPVSSTNKTHHHDITEILLKVDLNIKQTNKINSNFINLKMRWVSTRSGTSSLFLCVVSNQVSEYRLRDI